MLNGDIVKTKNILNVLVGKSLYKIERENRNIKLLFKADDNIYALEAICALRLYNNHKFVLASHDMYKPTDIIAKEDNFIWDNFPWYEHGNNKFDELLYSHFATNNFYEYIVNKIVIKKFGDVSILFENDYTLEIFSDASDYNENWRFGIQGAEKPLLLVAGIGLDHELME